MKQVIDLSGPEGNAFYLMAVVDKTFRRSGAPDLGKKIVEEILATKIALTKLLIFKNFKFLNFEIPVIVA